MSTYLFLYMLIFTAIISCQHTETKKSEASPAANTKNKDFEHANLLAKDGLYKEAINAYNAILKVKPKDRGALRNLGMVQVKIKNYKEAIKNLKSSLDRNDVDALFALGESHRAIENWADAIFYLKSALSVDPENLNAQKSLTWAHYKNKDFSASHSLADKMYKSHRNDAQVAIIFARVLIKVKQSKQALRVISTAKQNLSDQHSKAFFLSVEGDVHLSLNSCSKAIPVYMEALKDQPLLAGSLLGLGRCQIQVGAREKGIALVERALRIQPNLTEAYLTLAKAHENHNQQKSLAYYRMFQKLAKNDREYLSQYEEINKKVSTLRKQNSVN